MKTQFDFYKFTEKFWLWEIGFAVLFGVPIWVAAPGTGWPLALCAHLAVIGFYALTLRVFGRGSSIEMGVFVTIIAVLWAVAFPLFQRVKTRAERHQSAPRSQLQLQRKIAASRARRNGQFDK